MTNLRTGVDTNTLISSVLLANSVPNLAVHKARGLGVLLFSDATFAELNQVIFRPKFDKYVSITVRSEFISRLRETSEWINVQENVTICRDPKDDKFLAVVANGNANWLITGDRDLLVLQALRSTRIVSPAQFLAAIA
jgi:putative PIN family toxin of toxin-antitoxin system